MTKQEIINLYNNLNTLGDLRGVKFSYGVARNIQKLKQEVDAFQLVSKPSEEYSVFDNERIELAKSHSKKDDKGEPVVVGNEFQIEDEKKFNKELDALRKKHKSAIEAREKQIEEVTALLEEESTVELHKIKIEDVPEDITTAQMSAIFSLIEYEDNPKN